MAAGPESTPDPSMDDILASIRRILDEEEAKPEAAPEPAAQLPAEPGAEPAAGGEPDVLELEPSMLVPEPDEAAAGPVPSPPPILSEPAAGADRVTVAGPEREPAPLVVPLPPPVQSGAGAGSGAGLVAPEAAAAAASSLGSLMRTLASERSTAVSRGGPTLEDLVREVMRPLLKDWLDSHLPPLVERLVRAEIERVVNRGM